MHIFPHKYGRYSTFIKLLSFISLLTIIANAWNIYTFYPLYTFLNKMSFWEFFLNLPLQYLAFFFLVFFSGFTDSPGVLYFFPVMAYFLLTNKLCYLISNNKITYILISSLPSQMEAIFTCILLFLGLTVLVFWHRRTVLPVQVTKLISVNLNIIAYLAIGILILMAYLINEHFAYYLEKTNGLSAMALNKAGLSELIILGLIFIFGIKKWPSILWLFPFIAYRFVWPYVRELIYAPENLPLSIKILTILMAIFIGLGFYTLYLWFRQISGFLKERKIALRS